MPRLRTAIVALVIAFVSGQQTSAQNLAFSLFERYLDSLRLEAGIPGLSAAVIQNGAVAWERGMGAQNVDTGAPALPDTPYLIANLSQVVGSTLLLRKCVEQGQADVTDRVVRWAPAFGDPGATIRGLLTHASSGGVFSYDTTRFAGLTGVVEECAGDTYRELVAREIIERLGMVDAVPGHALLAPNPADRVELGARLDRYQTILSRIALPYRLDRGRAVRSEVAPRQLTASDGLVMSVRDLAKFDLALTNGILLSPPIRDRAWMQTSPLPTGYGWFVQNYEGEPIVWQFGLVRQGYSSLIVKVPNRGLTLILLANSDGLAAPYALEQGDITTSLFVRLFFRLLLV